MGTKASCPGKLLAEEKPVCYIKTERTEDICLYHDTVFAAVSISVAAAYIFLKNFLSYRTVNGVNKHKTRPGVKFWLRYRAQDTNLNTHIQRRFPNYEQKKKYPK